jgi:hypothetical protein
LRRLWLVFRVVLHVQPPENARGAAAPAPWDGGRGREPTEVEL